MDEDLRGTGMKASVSVWAGGGFAEIRSPSPGGGEHAQIPEASSVRGAPGSLYRELCVPDGLGLYLDLWARARGLTELRLGMKNACAQFFV